MLADNLVHGKGEGKGKIKKTYAELIHSAMAWMTFLKVICNFSCVLMLITN